MKRYPLLLCLSLLAACQPNAAPPADTMAAPAGPAAPTMDSAAPSMDPAVVPASMSDDHTQTNQRMTLLFGNAAPYEAAITRFQHAVREHDAEAVAEMMDFPFDTRIAGKVRTVADAQEFIRDYDAIVTADMAQVIASQRYDDLHTETDGIMFGRGEAWLVGVCVDHACKQVNVRVMTLQAPNLPATN